MKIKKKTIIVLVILFAVLIIATSIFLALAKKSKASQANLFDKLIEEEVITSKKPLTEARFKGIKTDKTEEIERKIERNR